MKKIFEFFAVLLVGMIFWGVIFYVGLSGIAGR